MRRVFFQVSVLASLVSLLSFPVFSSETLADWATHIDSPEIQQKILNLILPGQVGPVSASRVDAKSGQRLFTKGGLWVRLGADGVWSNPETKGYVPFMAVSVITYQALEKGPMSSTTYVLYDIQRKPVALSGGYAAHERVNLISLPKLKKSFLLLVGSSKGYGDAGQWTASLYPVGASGYMERTREVWLTPNSVRTFQLAFNDLGGKAELLLMRSSRGSDVTYKAYHWEGQRFEEDSFASESKMKSLPPESWKFGAPY